MVTIYGYTGNVILTTEVGDGSEVFRSLMGEHYISLEFYTAFYYDIPVGSYILYEGATYALMSAQLPERSGAGWKYALQFNAPEMHMQRYLICYTGQGGREMTFAITSYLATVAGLLATAMNDSAVNPNPYAWVIGDCERGEDSDELATVSFNGETVFDAATLIADTFDTEWWAEMTGETVTQDLIDTLSATNPNLSQKLGKEIIRLHFKKAESEESVDFEEGGIIDTMTPQSGDSSQYGTRFWCFGSTRNLTASYNTVSGGEAINAISEPRLRPVKKDSDGSITVQNPILAKNGEIVPSLSDGEIIDKTVFFEDEYPKNDTPITAVDTVRRKLENAETLYDQYVIFVEDANFDGDSSIIAGETLKCKFVGEGNTLVGWEFDLIYKKEADITPTTESASGTRTDEGLSSVDAVYVPLGTVATGSSKSITVKGKSVTVGEITCTLTSGGTLLVTVDSVRFVNVDDEDDWHWGHYAQTAIERTSNSISKITVSGIGDEYTYGSKTYRIELEVQYDIEGGSDSSNTVEVSYSGDPSKLKYTYSTGSAKCFEVVAQNLGDYYDTESGETLPLLVPNKNQAPAVGDTIVLENVIPTSGMITDAEEHLADTATEYARKNSSDTNLYECDTNIMTTSDGAHDYDIGQKVNLINAHYFSGGSRSSRIREYTKNFIFPYKATYTVGDNRSYSKSTSLTEAQDDAEYATRLGIASTAGIKVIRSTDDLPSDDTMVYSSLKVDELVSAAAASASVSVTDENPTLAVGEDAATYTVGTVSGTPLQVTVPSTDSIASALTDGGYKLTDTTYDLSKYALTASLAKVATSGLYSDLTGTPTIPANTSDLNNDSNFATTDDLTSAIQSLGTAGAVDDGSYIYEVGVNASGNLYVKTKEIDYPTLTDLLGSNDIGGETTPVYWNGATGRFETVVMETVLGDYITQEDLELAIQALDSQLSAASGYYITGITQIDGVINAITTAALPTIPTTLPNPYKLTVSMPDSGGTKYYDGTEAISVDLADVVTEDVLSGYNYATKTDLTNATKGYVTSQTLATYLTDYVLTDDLNQTLQDYAKTTAIPTKTSQLTNDSGYITSSALDGYAKETWVSNNYVTVSLIADYATTNYVDTELQDYAKADALEAYVKSEDVRTFTVTVNGTATEYDPLGIGNQSLALTIPTKLSDLTDDSSFVKSDNLKTITLTVNGTKYYYHPTGSGFTCEIALATTSAAGLMSAADKTSLDNLASYFELVTLSDGTQAIHALYGLYTDSFLSAHGADTTTGSSTGGLDEEAMWEALQSTTGTYAETQIAAAHIPTLTQDKIQGLSSDLSSLKTSVSTNSNNISSLTTRVGTAETNITTLQGYFTSGVANSAAKVTGTLTFTGSSTGTYNGSSDLSIAIPTVPTSLKNPYKLTFTGGSTVTYDGSAAKSVAIPTSLKSPYALTINLADGTSISYDGSATKTADLSKYATQEFVNSSISTNTATFRGTYESTDDLPLSGDISDLKANDYAFIIAEDSNGNPEYQRYKYSSTDDAWAYEYTLNNSSFTAEQWAAVQSGITSTLVTKLQGIATGAQVNVIESVKLNGTTLSVSSKAVNVNAATSITVPTGLSAASLTSAGKIAITYASGYEGFTTALKSTINAMAVTAGSTTKPIYFNAGVPTALSSTVGSGTKPVYLNAGTITASSSTVGSASKPIYMSSGTLTACSSTVGGTAKPVYMNSGTITALSSTVGSTDIPVYMSSGTITACGYNLATINGYVSNLLKGYSYVYTADLSSLDEDTYYPYLMQMSNSYSYTATNNPRRICVYVYLDSGTTPSWSAHSCGFACHTEWITQPSGYGVIPITRTIRCSTYAWCGSNPVRGIGQMEHTSREYVYLRGGGKYFIYTTSPFSSTEIVTDSVTYSNETISATTTAPAEITNTIDALLSWFGIDDDGNIYVKKDSSGNARGFYSYGFISARGVDSTTSSGSGGLDEAAMWEALQATTGTYASTEIASVHIPTLSMDKVQGLDSLSSSVTTLQNTISAMDATINAGSGNYIYGITQVDGKITGYSSAAVPTITSLMGSSAVGSTSAYIYWTGSAWATKTLGSRAFDSTSYLPLAGGTMSGNITFASLSTTDGTASKGLVWSGGTDGASIYYAVDASDQGTLYLKMTDDSNAYIKMVGYNLSGTVAGTIQFIPYSSAIIASTFTGLASKATADGSGNTITSTYIKALSVSGTTITYTYGDGTTKTITTQDTNTHYTTHLYIGASGAASNASTANGSTYLKLYDDSTSRASFKITGSGATTVASDSSGNITISSTNTTYTLAGLMGSSAKGSSTLPVYWTGSAFSTISSYSGNAATATTLATARTINGTSFNGSANITTSYWGTARTLTIGSTGKSVNGSAAVSWTQKEMGVPKVIGANYTFGGDTSTITISDFLSTYIGTTADCTIARGSWSYADNRYVSNDLGNPILLAGTAILSIGIYDTSSNVHNTTLFITPTTINGTAFPANEMVWYTSNVQSEGAYSPGWTRVVTNRNFTSIVTKLGTSTVGSSTNPVYLNAGTITASTSTVGSASKPIYMSSGTLTACSSTVGGAAKPVYMSSGTITACSSTVGSSTIPVYMSSGTITSCGYPYVTTTTTQTISGNKTFSGQVFLSRTTDEMFFNSTGTGIYVNSTGFHLHTACSYVTSLLVFSSSAATLYKPLTSSYSITCASLTASGEITANYSSDSRLKTNIDGRRDYRKALLRLGSVVDYEYTEEARKRQGAFADGNRHTGIIYQNALKAGITGLCKEDKDGYGSINPLTPDLIFTVTGALQQTIRKQDRQEQEIKRLKKRVKELEEQVNRLSA